MERLAGDQWTSWIRWRTDRPPVRRVITSFAELAGRLVPTDFPAYAKIFHRIDRDAAVDASGLTWDESDPHHGLSDVPRLAQVLADQGLTPVPSRGAGNNIARAERVPWRIIASGAGLAFDQDLSEPALYETWGVASWPRRLLGPAEGTLDRDGCAEVVRILLRMCVPQRVYVSFFSLARRHWDVESDLVFRGDLSEVIPLLDDGEFTCSPEYWWPEDRSWVVCTDYDSVFTIVAGPEALIGGVVESDELEAVRAVIRKPPQTR